MASIFQKYISIDWSGAGSEHDTGDFGIVEAYGAEGRVVPPPRYPRAGKWTRAECREWLSAVLRPDEPRTIVAIDFGFGLPWGADRSVFGCDGWRAMLEAIAKLYRQHGTARLVAATVNGEPRFAGHGPYRFNENRSDYRFYLEHGVAYYRLVESAIAQAISQWYMGSGGTVGFHTITGLAALHDLIALREAGEVAFRIWPHECDDPTTGADDHLLVESYPAIYPTPATFGPCVTPHQRDAWKVLSWMIKEDGAERLAASFALNSQPFGRIEGRSFSEQVRIEGWILGVS